MKFFKLLTVFFLLSNISCSSDKNDSTPNYTPLTQQQKLELREFSQSISDVGSATAGKAGKRKIRKPITIHNFNLQALPPIDDNEKRRQKLNEMEKSLEQCAYNSNVDDLIGDNSDNISPDEILARLEQGIYFDVNGQLCPLVLSFDASMKIDRNRGLVSGQMNLLLDITDLDLANISRVKKINLNGQISGQGSQSGSSISFSVTGNVDHLDKGLVQVSFQQSMNNNQSGSRTVTTIVYTFNNFKAVGDVVSTFNSETYEESVTYAINGESVTAQEFMDYFTGLSTTGQTGERNFIKTLTNF